TISIDSASCSPIRRAGNSKHESVFFDVI
ncbi:serine/threonine kinase, partial [Schistosoma mansoni]